MEMLYGTNFLAEKFSDVSVAFGVTIINETEEYELEHVNTYVHYGQIDPFYDIPKVLSPKVRFVLLQLPYFCVCH